MTNLPPHPMQSVHLDEDGTPRFRQNKIVRWLLDFSRSNGIGMNELADMPFDDEDREQLAQLIGYSVDGFGVLSYASEEVIVEADDRARALLDRTEKDGGRP